MNLSLTLTNEHGRWTATDRGTGLSASARAPDTAIGRLVIQMLVSAGGFGVSGNLRPAILKLMREQEDAEEASEGGVA